mgnify:FL=1
MALKVGELFASLGLDSSGFNRGLDSAGERLEAFGGRIQRLGFMLSAAVTAPLTGLGYAAVTAAGSMEQTRIALTTMLGSATKADRFIRDLQKFAQTTPFEFKGLIESSKTLMAFGFEAQEILPIMRALGDAISSIGGDSNTLDRVILQLGQMKTVGKASMADLRPIAQAGIRVFDYMAQEMGKSKAEIMDMLGKGELAAEPALSAIFSGLSKDPKLKGMMDKQSKSFLGMLSNLRDQVNEVLVPLGKPLVSIGKTLLTAMTPLINVIAKFAEALARSPKFVQVLTVAFGALAAAAGPLLMLIGSIASGIGTLVSVGPAVGAALGGAFAVASGPIGWVIGAIAALIALIVAAYKRSQGFREQMQRLWSTLKELARTSLALWKKLAELAAPFFQKFAKYNPAILQLKLVFNALLLILRGVVYLLQFVLDRVLLIAEAFKRLLNHLTGGTRTLLSGLIDLGISSVEAAMYSRQIGEERKRQVAEVAEAEAQAVLDQLENQRKLRAEERQRRMEQIGWLSSASELWTRGMSGALKAAEIGPKAPSVMTPESLPSAAELRRISEELKEQTELQRKTLKAVQQKLGAAYAT